jgi:hypothetical protein
LWSGLKRALFGGGSTETQGQGTRARFYRPHLRIFRTDPTTPDVPLWFTIRNTSGLLYDSRRVYDANDAPIAQFRGSFKTSIRGGFGVICMSGLPDDVPSIDEQPWLGHSECKENHYIISYICHHGAGKIAPIREEEAAHSAGAEPSDSDHARERQRAWRINFEQEKPTDETQRILILASALAVAWSPPPG